jgi:hypothetical protein
MVLRPIFRLRKYFLLRNKQSLILTLLLYLISLLFSTFLAKTAMQRGLILSSARWPKRHGKIQMQLSNQYPLAPHICSHFAVIGSRCACRPGMRARSPRPLAAKDDPAPSEWPQTRPLHPQFGPAQCPISRQHLRAFVDRSPVLGRATGLPQQHTAVRLGSVGGLGAYIRRRFLRRLTR